MTQTDPTPALRRRSRQREEARRAILDASESIVLEGGFEDGADVAVGHELARARRRLAVLPGFLVDQVFVSDGEHRPASPVLVGPVSVLGVASSLVGIPGNKKAAQ